MNKRFAPYAAVLIAVELLLISPAVGPVQVIRAAATPYIVISPAANIDLASALAINDKEQIAGYGLRKRAIGLRGFVYDHGVYTYLDVPNSSDTRVLGINNSGEVVGQYYRQFSHSTLFLAFMLKHGQYETLVQGDWANSEASAINNRGEIVGDFQRATKSGPSIYKTGFLLSHGSFSILTGPLGSVGCSARAINDHGQIVGSYIDSSRFEHGFLYSKGSYNVIHGPPDSTGCVPTGINNACYIVGEYESKDGKLRSFVLHNGKYTTLGENELANGINNAGELVGYRLLSDKKSQEIIVIRNLPSN